MAPPGVHRKTKKINLIVTRLYLIMASMSFILLELLKQVVLQNDIHNCSQDIMEIVVKSPVMIELPSGM